MNSTAQDIKDVLVSDGLGTYAAITGWGIYIGKDPDKPDSVITVFDTGGFEPDYVFNNAIQPLEHKTIMIHVRNQDYGAGYTKMQAVIDALDQRDRWTVGDVKYHGIFRQGDAAFVGFDDHNRGIWSVNFRVHRSEQ